MVTSALTTGDEAGERATRIGSIKKSHVFCSVGCDFTFLLSELDRVTAERDEIEAKSHLKLMAFRSIGKVEGERDAALEQGARDDAFIEKQRRSTVELMRERDAAIASRNAWAERCAGFQAALEACRSFLNDPEGFAGVTISDTVWTGPGETLKDRIEGALRYGPPEPAATEVKP